MKTTALGRSPDFNLRMGQGRQVRGKGASPSFKWQSVFCLAPVLAYLLLFFVLPLGQVLYRAIFDPGFTFRHFDQIVHSDVYVNVFLKTFLLAITVTGLSLVLGYPVAFVLVNSRKWLANIGWALVLIPFWTSLLSRNFAWMVLLQREGIISHLLARIGFSDIRLMFSFWGVVIAMVHVLMPFGILCMASVMKKIDKRLIFAAYSLGARPWRAFSRVYWPLSMPGVIAGGALIFILSLGFYITPALLGGRGEITVTMLVEQQVNTLLNWGFASALSVCLLGFILVFYIGASTLIGFSFAIEERQK